MITAIKAIFISAALFANAGTCHTTVIGTADHWIVYRTPSVIEQWCGVDIDVHEYDSYEDVKEVMGWSW